MRLLTACIACLCIVVIPLPVFAQSAQLPGTPGKNELPSYSKTLLLGQFVYDSKGEHVLGRWFNARVGHVKHGPTKEELREQWKEFLGIDVFYPYYKAKEVEKFVQSKTTIEFFNFKGRAEFEEGSSSVKYIFKKRF